MGINYRDGDVVKALLNEDVDFIIHCCNAQGVMGSGIAKQIKSEIPIAYQEYKNYFTYCDSPQEAMGGIPLGGSVFNLIGQEYYGKDNKRYAHYGAIAEGLVKISSIVKTLRLPESKIGIPMYFASDRAGADWDVILELIETLLSRDHEVYIYKL